MKTRIATLLSALALLTVSCEQDSNEGSVWGDPKFVRVVAPTEIVKAGSTELEIFYKEGQLIKVWEQAGNAVDLRINKDKDSVFFSYDWIPEAVPAYAAFPSSEGITCSAGGVFGVTVEPQQKVSGNNEIENFVAVGRITGANRTSYKSSPVRNITGFLGLEVAFPNISSINIEALGGEPVAGKVSVDCSKLESGAADYMSTDQAETQTSVTLVPADSEGTLNAGTYYAALLPGTYAKGLKLTVNYKQGLPVVKTFFAEGVTISRSALTMLADEPVDDDLPGDIRVDLKFSEGWPFVEPVVSTENQQAASFAGDTYTHMLKYEANGVEKEKGLPFFMKGNNQAYEYASNSLRPGKDMARMTLPAISGRYIRAVRMEVINEAPNTKAFRLFNMNWKILAESQGAYAGAPAMLSFPTETGSKSEFEAAYYMYFINANTSISTISILYSKELPSSYDDNPFGDEIVEPEPPVVDETLPEEFTLTLDFATAWPFKENCVDVGSQTDEGEKYTYTYNYEYNGTQVTKDLDFSIMRCGRGKSKSYAYSIGEDPHALCFYTDDANSTAMINFPVIPGRYVKEIRAVHNNTTSPYPRFNITQNFSTNITTAGRVNPGEETVFALPYKSGTTTITSELNQIYSLRTRDKNMKVTKVVITYSKTRPE